jgi:hypothetical protein
MRKTSRVVAAILALQFLAMGWGVAHAKNMKEQNLFELLTHTDSILIGVVASKTDGFQDGLPYTEITVNVRKSLKGAHGATYTFRQFGLIKPRSMGDGRVNLMVTPAGWPTYGVGERVMLFLHKPASETGFQTTAGLTMGKFTIRGDEIANDENNEGMFERMKIQASLSSAHADLVNQSGGAYKADAFMSLIQKAVEENWVQNGVISNEQ